MEIKMEIISNGKNYGSDLSSALKEAVDGGIMDIMIDDTSKRLAHIREAIVGEGGTITIEKKEDGFSVSWHGFSDNLSEQINQALSAE